MHPALKLFCILWLFMGALLTTIGFTQGIIPFGLIGLLLAGLSISGILGYRAAPMGLTFFWGSIFLAWIVLFLMGKAGPISRAILPCAAAFVFAFIAFLCGENPAAEDAPETQPEAEAEPGEN